MNSAIYSGTIFHRRVHPFEHQFKYKLFMVYLDLDEIEDLLPQSFFWGVERSALISFHREDYLHRPEKNLNEAVRNLVFEKIGKTIEGPIYLLAHLRYFGHCFNPVSFYYCFDRSGGEVETVIADVTNTPWKERHSYVIERSPSQGVSEHITDEQTKKLHVSPFFDMDHQYQFLFSSPNDSISVQIENFREREKVHEAVLNLKRIQFSKTNLLKAIIQFPFLTLRIVATIHWQAVKLWLKGATFYPNPGAPTLPK